MDNKLFYKIAALTILAFFYGCYIIKMLLQKRKGIKTNQIGKGKSGSAKLIECIMKIATYLTPVLEILSIFFIKNISPFWLKITGIGFGVAGDIIFIISVVTMKDSWRAGVSETDKTALVTDGIYKISRNPAFLGFDMVYIGILCMYFNWILLLSSVFAILMFELQIVFVEEKFLIRTFGKEYEEYKKHVNRYFGRR